VVEWNTVQCNLIDVARMENVDYMSLRYHVFHRGRPLQTAISILRAQGQVFYERATEKGSTRKNKTDVVRCSCRFTNEPYTFLLTPRQPVTPYKP
jgi:hypothetical protein